MMLDSVAHEDQSGFLYAPNQTLVAAWPVAKLHPSRAGAQAL